ncbi:MAG: aminotransferase class V-fold PLP-dependent enzyme [Candidatus Thorarchaeota archaeon]
MTFIYNITGVKAMPDTIDYAFVEEHFPTLQDMVYLNNAATGILPIKTVEAMKEYLDERSKAEGDLEETEKGLKAIRERLAQLLGGKDRQYGFMPSTSAGLNAFAHGISYPSGSNIVICDLEFPANYVPWQNVSRHYDVELRVANSEDGAVPIDSFRELIDENTKIVAVSLVQFGSGFRTDVAKLGDYVHEYGGYLVADIIQGAGWLNIDLAKARVDFAAGQAAKWLVGPIGAGYAYIRESIIDEVKPRFLGWWGVENMEEFEYSEKKVLGDARKFEVGSPALISYVGFSESLKILLELESRQRESAALENADYLRKRLEERGIEYYDFDDHNKSPIVSCTPPNVEELQKELHKKKIHCSVRNGRLRVSPHFYNTHAEIDTMMENIGW